MSDYVTSLLRTWVTTAVGATLAWLATLGADVGAQARTGLVIGLTGAVTAAYYAIVRGLERRWPLLGLMLGSARQPTYTTARRRARP